MGSATATSGCWLPRTSLHAGWIFPAVSHVFNFDVPGHPEDYVHRIGRTGRAGRDGKALTLCSSRDEKAFAAVEALIQKEIPRLENPVKPQKPVADEDVADEVQEDSKPSRSRGRGGRGRGDRRERDDGGRGDKKARRGLGGTSPELHCDEL